MQRKKKWNGYRFLVAGWWQKERQRGNKTASPTADSGQRNKIIYWCCRGNRRQEKYTKYQNSAKLVIMEGTRLHVLQGYYTLQPRSKQSPRWGDMQCPIPGTHNSNRHPGTTRLCSAHLPLSLGWRSHQLPPHTLFFFLTVTEGFTSPLLLSSQIAIWSRQCLLASLITVFPCS